jgi:hypothetical protein
MKEHGRMEVKLLSFLILALDGIIDQLYNPDAFPPDEIAHNIN